MDLSVNAPNYKEYSLHELNDALVHIDREQFPERTNALIQEIESRREHQQEQVQTLLPEFNEKLHPNVFIRYWKGQVSLPVSYWAVGIAVSLLFVFLSKVVGKGIESATSSTLLGAYILGLYTLMIVLLVWQSVGVYRSAGKHTLRGGSVGWAYTAKLMVFVGLFSFLNQMYISGFPIMKSGFLTLIGTEIYPVTQFRVLNGGKELELFGGIELGSETLLEEQLDLNPDVKLLHLHSTGGRVLAAKRMMKVLRRYGIDTYVRTECSSSCTLLFLAGKNKLLGSGAKLKFHAASIGTVSGHNVKEIGQNFEEAYLNEGIPKWFVDKIANTPSDSFWEPSNNDLLRAGVIDKIVDPELYAFSGIGAETSITIEDIVTGLLTQDYILAMKEHDPETYQQAIVLNHNGMLEGLPSAQITNQLVDLLYNVRLPVYLASASNTALVEYWKAQIFRMEELRKDYPLACASFVYPDEVPAEKRYGNQGGISEEGKAIESAALTELIKSYQGSYQNIDEETQQLLVQEVITKIRNQNEEFFKVVSSAKDFVNKPELMCAASIALNKAFISFDVDTSGQLLRSIQN
jgi:hypothetical protein